MATVITYDPKPLTTDQLQTLSLEIKQALAELYGDRLDRIILYGSYARGDFNKESDVDYLVVLNDDNVKIGREIQCIVDSIFDLTEKYGVMVSVNPTSSAKYQQSDLFFYRNVRREGHLV